MCGLESFKNRLDKRNINTIHNYNEIDETIRDRIIHLQQEITTLWPDAPSFSILEYKGQIILFWSTYSVYVKEDGIYDISGPTTAEKIVQTLIENILLHLPVSEIV